MLILQRLHIDKVDVVLYLLSLCSILSPSSCRHKHMQDDWLRFGSACLTLQLFQQAGSYRIFDGCCSEFIAKD